MWIEHGQENITLPKHGGEFPLADANTVQSNVHFVLFTMAGKRPEPSGPVLKLQFYPQITGILVIEIVDLRTGVEAHAGDGKGDGVGNAAFPHPHMAGDHIHIAKLKGLLIRISLKSTDGEPGHTELLDRLDHLTAPLLCGLL